MLKVSIQDPKLEQLVQEKLKSGEFGSADDLVAASLMMYMNDPDEQMSPDDRAQLRQEISTGITQADRGEIARWDPNEIKAAIRRTTDC